MALSRGLSSGRTLARGHREACCGLKIWIFHPHDSTKTQFFPLRPLPGPFEQRARFLCLDLASNEAGVCV
jgi:hypothetical protein